MPHILHEAHESQESRRATYTRQTRALCGRTYMDVLRVRCDFIVASFRIKCQEQRLRASAHTQNNCLYVYLYMYSCMECDFCFVFKLI